MAKLPHADRRSDRTWLAVGAGAGHGDVIGVADDGDGRSMPEEAVMLRHVKIHPDLH